MRRPRQSKYGGVGETQGRLKMAPPFYVPGGTIFRRTLSTPNPPTTSLPMRRLRGNASASNARIADTTRPERVRTSRGRLDSASQVGSHSESSEEGDAHVSGERTDRRRTLFVIRAGTGGWEAEEPRPPRSTEIPDQECPRLVSELRAESDSHAADTKPIGNK